MYRVSLRYVSIDGKKRKAYSILLPRTEAMSLYSYYANCGHIVDVIHVRGFNGEG